jgi:hypothetical protein
MKGLLIGMMIHGLLMFEHYKTLQETIQRISLISYEFYLGDLNCRSYERMGQ